ncbi:hypothetical protein PINS_up010778 [Pythium insidiosum]|nr:hypothetical protein PINS_up010778 [Pythium insidiosum]
MDHHNSIAPKHPTNPQVMKVLCFLAAVAMLSATDARPTYVTRIPNGRAVNGVSALGHKQTSGGGPLNAFGEAFSTAGQQWTVELCKADSDGDGQTNGQELGDPCCEWTASGGQPRYSTGVSHPGDATSKADPSLWASITCSNSTSTSGASPSAASPSAATTAPSPSSSAAAMAGGSVVAVTAAATIVASVLVHV